MSEDSTGLKLDQHFDLEIDAVGDINTVSGVEELQKDLAGQLSELVNTTTIGTPLRGNDAVELESSVFNVVNRDPRVTEVEAISVRSTPRDSTISIDISADSIYGPFDASF